VETVGLPVEYCTSAETAIELLKARNYGCVVLDLILATGLSGMYVVEAARSLAARIMKEGGRDATTRVKWAWREALARDPRADEMKTVRALLEKHLAEYQRDPPAAAALLKVGLSPAPKEVDASELAAWTQVCRVILNLHETITRY